VYGLPAVTSLHSTITENLQKHTDWKEGLIRKNMATENSLYNASSTIHSRYYRKEITQQLETA
jgi:hypothetical protein